MFECESRISNFANKHYSDNWIERCDDLDKKVGELRGRVIELGRKSGGAAGDDDEMGFGMDEDKVKEIARDMCRDVAREAAKDIVKENVDILTAKYDGEIGKVTLKIDCVKQHGADDNAALHQKLEGVNEVSIKE